jgi:hypothetical protein
MHHQGIDLVKAVCLLGRAVYILVNALCSLVLFQKILSRLEKAEDENPLLFLIPWLIPGCEEEYNGQLYQILEQFLSVALVYQSCIG